MNPDEQKQTSFYVFLFERERERAYGVRRRMEVVKRKVIEPNSLRFLITIIIVGANLTAVLDSYNGYDVRS